MTSSTRPGLLLLMVLALVPCGAEVTVSPTAWKPDGVQRLDKPLVKAFTVANTADKQVTIVSFSGSNRAQIQLERTILPPNSETKMTVSLPLQGIDSSSTVLAGQVLLLLDSQQDSVTVPFEIQLAGPDTAPVALPQRDPYQAKPTDHAIDVQFFYDGTCGKCEAFIKTTIEPCRMHFASADVTFHLKSFRDAEVLTELESYKLRYGVTEEASTYFFCGKHAYVGNDAIEAHLYEVIEAELAQPTAVPQLMGPVGPPISAAVPSPDDPGQDLVVKKFAKYTAPAVFLGGMVDGINPCAIAMAVFLIVMLTKLGHDRTALLAAGGAFAAAVFLTYFLIGMAVLKSISLFGSRQLAGQLLNGAVGLAALAFAGLQVRDVVRLRAGGGTRDVTMQMPLKFKQLSHKFVREGLARPAVIVGAATAGMLVTLLEAVCTGQMYVPVLAAVANTPALRPRALELLTIYNLGFVFPLLVILAMTYQGVTSESLAASAKRHLIPAKLALAALLGALGAYLLAAAVHPH